MLKIQSSLHQHLSALSDRCPKRTSSPVNCWNDWSKKINQGIKASEISIATLFTVRDTEYNRQTFDVSRVTFSITSRRAAWLPCTTNTPRTTGRLLVAQPLPREHGDTLQHSGVVIILHSLFPETQTTYSQRCKQVLYSI
ncbi:hypothetical protein E2C01_048994 [Portunus trituberculatus]|uniref:Uncharacterized protein n=1 Tax=Portunus trituberculatus TaxID=210409 RepID=A0A5B7G814_PORTR|nr:hypothetical protein [Portunus trituberculatus]